MSQREKHREAEPERQEWTPSDEREIAPEDEAEEAAAAGPAPGEGHTLADGRVGSHRPLSEAHPGEAQPGSVRAKAPHADTKLSSSRGLTQEREGRTLAAARPENLVPDDD
jgi:hypothetical protein